MGDIATRHAVTNTFALRVLFKKLAESVKQPISFSRLTNIISSTGVKVGKSTVINYLEYAKDAWLVTPVQNIAGKLVEKETTPKYYFTDNGILYLFLLDAETSLLENLVAITLLRKYGREDAVFSTTRTWKWTSIYLTRRQPSKYAILFQTQQPLNGRPRLLSIYARSYPARIYSLSPGMRKRQWSWEAEK